MIVVAEEAAAKREKMTIDERYKLIRNVKPKYPQISWKENSQVLYTWAKLRGSDEKHLIALLHGLGSNRKRRERQRGYEHGA